MTKAGPDIALRLAAAGDLDAVAVLWHHSASRMDGAGTDIPTREDLRRRIDAELAAGWELHLAARGGEVLGMLALKPADTTLDQLFVSPEHQGQGIGRALLDLAKRRLPQGFTLRAAASNAQARAFYQREDLRLLHQGAHPRSGAPVFWYGWTPA